MIRFKNIVACALVMLIAYSPLSHSAVMSLPGIPESGNPNFYNDAQINLFDLGGNNYLFAATNSGAPLTFNLGSTSVTSSASHPAYFVLTALFSGDGSYIANTGALSISGEIPFPYANLPGVFISGDLLTAKLDNFAFDSDTLGFSTNQISGFGTLFGSAESVYLSATGLASALGFGSGALIATTSPLSASAITTVPVPGAGWLIGSAFGLFTLLRKNRLTAEIAC
ncbi:hypothetical protein [Methylomonas rivi]|uniref:PEP-CTERM sorting domain-containing protein n=1 Tax=Methylomonas rivi TaxID=2952226 RepID=A0ABT1U1L6_9GAMM|nr:hypothetical protein [Methylomonas sp. WSC-6]MBS4050959.1 hypothetical protein [Methylomonas sp.]MCQ8127339.1 hypothetical protein [Methylomonas sp. WSC-6]